MSIRATVLLAAGAGLASAQAIAPDSVVYGLVPSSRFEVNPGKEDPSVIRISRTRETTHVVTLKVEGALVAGWVPVLESVCASHLAERKGVELDFEDVSFLDREAATTVRELIANGVTILHPTPLVQHLLRRDDPL